jgi:hypothetical protein
MNIISVCTVGEVIMTGENKVFGEEDNQSVKFLTTNLTYSGMILGLTTNDNTSVYRKLF